MHINTRTFVSEYTYIHSNKVLIEGRNFLNANLQPISFVLWAFETATTTTNKLLSLHARTYLPCSIWQGECYADSLCR